MFFFSYFY